MLRAIAILILAAGLAGCDLVTALVDGAKAARAVETDLEEATGMKPDVGFNWKNDSLRVVTVTFPQLYETRPLGDLADVVRGAVKKEFKQPAKRIVLAFSMPGTAPGKAAQGGLDDVNFGPTLAQGAH